MQYPAASTALPSAAGGTGQGRDLQQPLRSRLEPQRWDWKAGEGSEGSLQNHQAHSLRGMSHKYEIQHLFHYHSTLLVFPEKKNSMDHLSVFPGRAGHPCLKSSPCPMSRCKLTRVKKCQLHLITQKHSDAFPRSCPYNSYTWKSYVQCNSPSGYTRKITIKMDRFSYR